MRSPQSVFGPHQTRVAKPNRTRHRFSLWPILLLLIVAGISFKQMRSLLRQPQAVLVLGGAIEREEFAAQFAHQHPDLPIWVSSGSNPEYAEWMFVEAGISLERVHLNYDAQDTVTNFTTLVDDFKTQNIRSIYLITSDYHMRRARWIGEIVLGSRGIDYRPIAVPSEQSPEPVEKSFRDAVRAMLWVTTGHTGSTLGQVLQPQRPRPNS